MSQRKVAAAPVHTRIITSTFGFPSSPAERVKQQLSYRQIEWANFIFVILDDSSVQQWANIPEKVGCQMIVFIIFCIKPFFFP